MSTSTHVNLSANVTSFDCPIAEDIWYANVIMYFITLVLGIVGNTLVLVIVVKRKRKRSVNDIFIANLAISDLALLLFFLPTKLYLYLICDPRVPFEAFCKLIYPIAVSTFSTSIFTMTAMSLHRCRRIVAPLLAPDRRMYTYVWIGLIWILSITLVLPLIALTKLDPKSGMCIEEFPSIKTKKMYTAALFVFQYMIPLFIISGAYLLIFRDLNKSNVRRASINRKGRVTTNCSRSENRQVVRTIAAIVFLFVFCTFPNQIAWMASDFGNEQAKRAAIVILTFSDILAAFHSCLNPIVYGSFTRYFRRGFFRYLCCLSSHKSSKRSLSQTGSFTRGPSRSYFLSRTTTPPSHNKERLIQSNM